MSQGGFHPELIVSIQSAECLCQPGYAGDNCETDIDDCAEVPCKNGGVCTDKVNGFQCDCAGSGFMGRTCQENIDECAVEAPCHHGRCNDTIGDYQCLCEESYCGKNCNVKDPCLLNVSPIVTLGSRQNNLESVRETRM